MTSPQGVGAEWSVHAVYDKKIGGGECRARLQEPSQRLADVRWVKTGKINMASPHEVRYVIVMKRAYV